MAKNYTLALRKSMKQLGTYRPEYESAIAIAAQLMEQYDTLTCAFEESGWASISPVENSSASLLHGPSSRMPPSFC